MVEARAEVSTGRPKITVDGEEMKILRSLRMTWEEISQIMGVSIKTFKEEQEIMISNDFPL